VSNIKVKLVISLSGLLLFFATHYTTFFEGAEVVLEFRDMEFFMNNFSINYYRKINTVEAGCLGHFLVLLILFKIDP
jgi:hypothetical protein